MFLQPQDAQAGAVSLLGVISAIDDPLDQRSGSGASLFGPANDPRGRPLQIILVRWWHVLCECGVAVRDKRSDMDGHPFALKEGFQCAGGQSHMEFLTHQPERNAVIMLVDLD